MPLPLLERRFITFCAAGLPALALGMGLVRGWHGALATLLAGLLAAADFLWMARGLRLVATPGKGVPRGLLGRTLGALVGRSLLLLLGFYAILHILPGEGVAVAAGLGLPLALLAAAGLTGTRS